METLDHVIREGAMGRDGLAQHVWSLDFIKWYTDPDTKTVLAFDGVDSHDLREAGSGCPSPADNDLVSLIEGRDIVSAHANLLHSGASAPRCVARYVPAAE